ncbi:Sigma-70 family RNA polymerase sigma factor [Sulfidibacter corallicola]|uniref:Sigma-70 family RNA polymerase sigma factor n=1 Tax=Sulfidibacter corallicola TaxID=2818388 RepID=A0A8A4TWW7_SULCO|nr:sigma-70 family RNA polymerase sigma factor [Sulfidibacter corallicola]QTD53963.1 sigma-70 family RNA polymerase sigma factor [Sulfidibacter corallicola]
MQEFYDAILPLSDRLYRYAYRLTQNDKDAEDLVQDTLLRAYSKFEQYQSGTSPLAWMLVILRSIFINKYRKKKREGHQISFEDMTSGVDRLLVNNQQDLPKNPEDFLFRNVLDAELRDALAKLPQHYLEVILLVDLEDLAYREAADVLGIPAGTVMSRLHRARKTLQAQLQELARKKGIVKTNVQPIFGKQEIEKSAGGTQYGS